MPKLPDKLWEEACDNITKVGGKSSGSGNNHWDCKFCKKHFTGPLPRLEAHIGSQGGVGASGCPKCPRSMRRAVQIKNGWKVTDEDDDADDQQNYEENNEMNVHGTTPITAAAMPIPVTPTTPVTTPIGQSSSSPAFHLSKPPRSSSCKAAIPSSSKR